jgi:hypothetical protein
MKLLSKAFAIFLILGTVGSTIHSLHGQSRQPAYVITEIEVTDADAFREYAPKVQLSFAPFGGRYVVRGDSDAIALWRCSEARCRSRVR